jgi:glycosyltransferase involved in cell wall biosynthesis
MPFILLKNCIGFVVRYKMSLAQQAELISQFGYWSYSLKSRIEPLALPPPAWFDRAGPAPQPPVDAPPGPRCSVVVPTRNRAASLSRLLEALARQTLPLDDFEVVVVNDGSADSTDEAVAAFMQTARLHLRVVKIEHRGVAAARNAGVRAGRGQFIAFVDDDCVPAPDWLATLLYALRSSEAAGAGGLALPAPAGSPILDYYRAYEVITRPGRDADQVLYLITCNAIFRKSWIEAAGGFDEKQNPAGEDLALSASIRARGGFFVYEPRAVVEHFLRGDLIGFLRTHFNYGRGETIRLRRDPVPTKIARLLYRSRQFLLWALLPWYWFKSFRAPGLTGRQALLFPVLERTRQTLLVLGQWREARRAFLPCR